MLERHQKPLHKTSVGMSLNAGCPLAYSLVENVADVQCEDAPFRMKVIHDGGYRNGAAATSTAAATENATATATATVTATQTTQITTSQ